MVVSHSKLAESFRNGATSGKSNTMFIEGDTIYSYGYHFPIARRFGDKFLFTTNKYSITTAKHKSEVSSALSDCKLIYVSKCELSNTKAQIEHNTEKIEERMDKITRARSPTIIEWYKSEIVELKAQNKDLAEIENKEGVTA
ncbi:MAG: hypothetical protein GY861_17360 [bacterium]|nr:hypothetical protein [bacterium]